VTFKFNPQPLTIRVRTYFHTTDIVWPPILVLPKFTYDLNHFKFLMITTHSLATTITISCRHLPLLKPKPSSVHGGVLEYDRNRLPSQSPLPLSLSWLPYPLRFFSFYFHSTLSVLPSPFYPYPFPPSPSWFPFNGQLCHYDRTRLRVSATSIVPFIFTTATDWDLFYLQYWESYWELPIATTATSKEQNNITAIFIVQNIVRWQLLTVSWPMPT